MQYLLLIYEAEAQYLNASEADQAATLDGYRAFGEHAQANGNLLGGNALQPTVTATTVKVRDGKTITTDGPFAETKEQLGGYYLVEAKDLDEAIDLAARIPGASTGCIEVRPIWEVEG